MSHRLFAFVKVAGVCSALFFSSSCLDGNGLDTGGGGGIGSGTGGSVGGGGKGSGTGGNQGSGGITQCGPVCDIFCEFGNVSDANGCPTCSCNPGPVCPALGCDPNCPAGVATDANGCPTCQCKPTMCPAIACPAIFCPYGNVVDPNGCPTCACKPGPTMCAPTDCGPRTALAIACPGGGTPPVTCEPDANNKCTWKIGQCPDVCPGVVCNLFCPYGNLVDQNGCTLCKCNPAPDCAPTDCGAPPPIAAIICGDGSKPPAPMCTRDAAGKCGWVVGSCPKTCADSRDLKTCESNANCQWLEPGCSGVKLPVAGCFARTDVGCKDGSCTGGRTCQSRTVDQCKGRPNMLCITCASPTNVCL